MFMFCGLAAGVVSVLESVPLAVLVMIHLGEPAPDKCGSTVAEAQLPVRVAARLLA